MKFLVRHLLLTTILLIGMVNILHAHAAIVWAYAEGDTVYVEAFFANGTKIQNTKVVVLDSDNKQVLEGKTDQEGKFQYKPKNQKKQTIVVVSGESHVGDFELTAEDLHDLVLKDTSTK